jgi:hypothetical protein
VAHAVHPELYRLDNQGRGQRIVAPARDRPRPGVAYWIACARAPAYQSALQVTAPGAGLEFGPVLVRQDLTIRNVHPTDTLTACVVQRDSEAAPLTGGFPELAGPVPLSYRARTTSNTWFWLEFPAAGVTQTLAPGESWRLRLGVRRSAFAPYTPQGTNGASYQSILEVTDSAQSLLVRVPVVAQKPEGIIVGGAPETYDDNQGLWIGTVKADRVNAPAYGGTNLLSTPAPLSFRLLVHVDGYGQARLLQRVLLAWDSTLTNAPHTNGTYALYAQERAVPSTATDVNRISSVGFAPMIPLLLTGSFTNTLSGTVTVRFDDPCNPFLHRYHPLHDNQDWDFRPYTNAVETRTIVRDITLSFGADTNTSANPFYGVDTVSGIYHETLASLRAQPIYLEGAFSLQRISSINELRGMTP